MSTKKKPSARPSAKKEGGGGPITSGRPVVGLATSTKKPVARATQPEPKKPAARNEPAPKAKAEPRVEVKVEKDASKDQIAALEKKLAAAEAALEAQSVRREKADADARHRIDSLQALINEAEARGKKLEAKVRDAEQNAREFEAEAKAVRVRIESLEGDLAAKVATPDRKRVLKTKLTEMLGSEWPIIQTGMGWVSGPKLTAATSAAGGFGILAAATMTFDELDRAIEAVKSKTDKPFGVNLRADQADAEQRCDLLIKKKIRVASFAQAPSEKLIKKLKDAGVLVIPTIGARRHAEKVAKWGVDAVIAQGQEGGGHTGTVPTSLLVLECAKAVSIPVIGAGGFSTGQGLVAALAYGGQGIAMGTRFLLTQESGVPEHVKAQYLKATVNDTVVTRAIDGHPQRVIRTPLVDELEKAGGTLALPLAMKNALSLMRVTGTSVKDLVTEGLAMKKNQDLTWAQLAMAANAPMLTKATMVDGKLEAGILPTGQVAGTITELPTVAELIARIVAEAEATLARLA